MKVSVITLFVAYLFSNSLCAQAPGPGTALDFDGVNDFIDANSTSLDSVFNDFTIEFWYKATNNISIKTEQNGLGDISGASGQRYLIFPTFGGSPSGIADRAGMGVSVGQNAIQVFEHRDSYLPALLSYSGPLLQNNWAHVAIVYTAKQPQLYLNGELAHTGLTSNQDTVSPSCLIAGGPFGRYQGELDELRIWNDSRTADEIRGFMCSKLKGNEAGLIRYFRFDDGVGSSSIKDETGNQSGTLSNMDPNSDWVTSGATLGDSSTFSYSVFSTSTSLTIPSAHGDNLSLHVNSTSTPPTGIHIYSVNQAPNVTTAPSAQNQLSTHTYYGVKVVGGTGIDLTIVYDYANHSGISDENNLELASRDDNLDATWAQENAVLNATSDVLSLDIDSSGEFILASTSSNPLPVTLSHFSLNQSNSYVQLRWHTANELNNSHFTVQRSADGFNWYSLKVVQGGGTTSNAQYYSYLDTEPLSDITYYRLRQTDFNGQSEYSQVLSSTFQETETSTLSLYPNPTSGKALIRSFSPISFPVELLNSQGVDLSSLVQCTPVNSSLIQIDLSTLPTGLYFVRVGNNVQVLHKI